MAELLGGWRSFPRVPNVQERWALSNHKDKQCPSQGRTQASLGLWKHMAGSAQLFSMPFLCAGGWAIPDTERGLHGKPQQGTCIPSKGLTDLRPVAVV